MDGVVGSDISSQYSVQARQGSLYSSCLRISSFIRRRTSPPNRVSIHAKLGQSKRTCKAWLRGKPIGWQGTEALAAFSTDSRYTHRRQNGQECLGQRLGRGFQPTSRAYSPKQLGRCQTSVAAYQYHAHSPRRFLPRVTTVRATIRFATLKPINCNKGDLV